mmetsp:Transcript_5845/g.11975  ORF Transcript_5845/g.11975 Transcript_5845/m.11975 type:complete len:105 (+) Transcript_5845:548-862(+)
MERSAAEILARNHETLTRRSNNGAGGEASHRKSSGDNRRLSTSLEVARSEQASSSDQAASQPVPGPEARSTGSRMRSPSSVDLPREREERPPNNYPAMPAPTST